MSLIVAACLWGWQHLRNQPLDSQATQTRPRSASIVSNPPAANSVADNAESQVQSLDDRESQTNVGNEPEVQVSPAQTTDLRALAEAVSDAAQALSPEQVTLLKKQDMDALSTRQLLELYYYHRQCLEFSRLMLDPAVELVWIETLLASEGQDSIWQELEDHATQSRENFDHCGFLYPQILPDTIMLLTLAADRGDLGAQVAYESAVRSLLVDGRNRALLNQDLWLIDQYRARALDITQQALRSGHYLAFENMADVHAMGILVPRSPIRARAYQLAALRISGLEQESEALESFEPLTPKEEAAARRMVPQVCGKHC